MDQMSNIMNIIIMAYRQVIVALDLYAVQSSRHSTYKCLFRIVLSERKNKKLNVL